MNFKIYTSKQWDYLITTFVFGVLSTTVGLGIYWVETKTLEDLDIFEGRLENITEEVYKGKVHTIHYFLYLNEYKNKRFVITEADYSYLKNFIELGDTIQIYALNIPLLNRKDTYTIGQIQIAKTSKILLDFESEEFSSMSNLILFIALGFWLIFCFLLFKYNNRRRRK